MPSRRQLLMFGGLVMLVTAVALTAVSTPAPHTGGDNAAYLSLAHSLVTGRGYTELWDPALPPHTKYPPLFPLTLAAMMLGGASSWVSFKLFAAFAVSAALVLVYAWAARRVGPLAGAAVALLTLMTGGWLQASRWILSEPLFLVLTFLALWAGEAGKDPRAASPEAAPSEGERPVAGVGARGPWLAVAVAAAILGFFTRSAGLPLVVAIFLALLLVRRIRATAVSALCFAVPGALWFLRARQGGAGAYQSEFWMVDPYQPELGTVGWLDLPARVWANLRLYVGDVLPGEWWPGAQGSGRVLLGVALVAFAVWGWAARMRRPTAAELFVPLYLGLILLWPVVWSGDRFTLPLYPLILVYAGETLVRAVGRLGDAGSFAAIAVAFVLAAAPTLPRWMTLAQEGGACRRVARAGDPIACNSPAFQEFRYAASWEGENLPDGSVVLNRKPRIHYLLGGPVGRTFPFTRDPAPFLTEADRSGARYVLVDHLDAVALFYVPAVVAEQPGAFCHVMGWGGGRGLPGTDILGILPPEERLDERAAGLNTCPPSFLRGAQAPPADYGGRIPRLVIDARAAQLSSSASGSP